MAFQTVPTFFEALGIRDGDGVVVALWKGKGTMPCSKMAKAKSTVFIHAAEMALCYSCSSNNVHKTLK